MWGIIELMGHRQHHGLITEVTFAGVQMIRVQVPCPEKQTDANGAEVFAETHLYSPSSLYGLHECTEQTVRDRVAPFKGYSLTERTEVDTERPDDWARDAEPVPGATENDTEEDREGELPI